MYTVTGSGGFISYHPGDDAVVHKIYYTSLRNLYGHVCEAGDVPPELRASHWLKPAGENMSSNFGIRSHLQYFICLFPFKSMPLLFFPTPSLSVLLSLFPCLDFILFHPVMPNSVFMISLFVYWLLVILTWQHKQCCPAPVFVFHTCITPSVRGGRAAIFSQTSYATVYCRLQESVDAPAHQI